MSKQLYGIEHADTLDGRHFVISKLMPNNMQVVSNTYNVSLGDGEPGSLVMDPAEVNCDCMGFKMQKYSKVLHKHVRMAIDFDQRSSHQKLMVNVRGAYYSIEKDGPQFIRWQKV